ncbi:MAG: response regulator transcription factor [Kiritimatiellia bacterium]
MKHNAARVLIAEDDPAIRRGLVDTLESEGYQALEAVNGLEALERLKAEAVDLLILDLMMPGKSGYEVCRELRRDNQHLPVLMLTAKGEEIDKVLGLELGADDYMTKPFGLRELVARVHALLRRSRPAASASDKESFSLGALHVDPRKLCGHHAGKRIELSAREISMLQLFASHPGEVLSRDELLNHGWGIDYYGTTRTLDQHIAQLRKKIEPDRHRPVFIQTVHGSGYRYPG